MCVSGIGEGEGKGRESCAAILLLLLLFFLLLFEGGGGEGEGENIERFVRTSPSLSLWPGFWGWMGAVLVLWLVKFPPTPVQIVRPVPSFFISPLFYGFI